VQHPSEQGHSGGVRALGRPAESDDQALPIRALTVPMIAEAFERKAFSRGQGDEFVLGRPAGGKPDHRLEAGRNADDQVWLYLLEGGDQHVAASAVAQPHGADVGGGGRGWGAVWGGRGGRGGRGA